MLNKLLVENEYHCITGSFRLKILNFRIFPLKKFSIIYLRDQSDSFTLWRILAPYLSEVLRSQNYFTQSWSGRSRSRLFWEQPRAAPRASWKTTVTQLLKKRSLLIKIEESVGGLQMKNLYRKSQFVTSDLWLNLKRYLTPYLIILKTISCNDCLCVLVDQCTCLFIKSSVTCDKLGCF